MDDSKVRNISEETIKKVIAKFNPDFVKELPCAPEEIAKFAIRRTDPVISDGISFSLGQAMLNSRLSDEEYLEAFYKIVHTSFYGKNPTDKPSAHMLVAQTGAGKTNLTESILSTNPNTLVINPDLCKKYNPNIEKILKEDPTHLGALTGIDSYDHAKNLQDFAISKGFNLLYECAPSEKRGLLGVNMETLEKHGYNIEYHILAIGNLLSAMAIHLRYEEDITKNPTSTSTKLTDLSRHDDSYRGVDNVIKNLPVSNKVSIYRRGKKEEGFVPQVLAEYKNATAQDVMPIVEAERKRSNKAYVFESTNSSFQQDFNKIEDSMKKRGAPELQFKQLDEIYNRYLIYLNHLNYLKSQQENGFDVDDM